MSTMNTYISFLRGVNVGGKNKVKMKDLVTHLQETDMQKVQFYLQSGNIFFESNTKDLKIINELISETILKYFLLRIEVVTLPKEQVKLIFENYPFKNIPQENIYFGFWNDFSNLAPSHDTSINIHTVNNDEYCITHNMVYMNIHPPYHKTKLTTAFFDSKFKISVTTRNYNTVKALIDM